MLMNGRDVSKRVHRFARKLTQIEDVHNWKEHFRGMLLFLRRGSKECVCNPLLSFCSLMTNKCHENNFPTERQAVKLLTLKNNFNSHTSFLTFRGETSLRTSPPRQLLQNKFFNPVTTGSTYVLISKARKLWSTAGEIARSHWVPQTWARFAAVLLLSLFDMMNQSCPVAS